MIKIPNKDLRWLLAKNHDKPNQESMTMVRYSNLSYRLRVTFMVDRKTPP